MAINVKQLQGYMGAGLNIMITGPAGTGKTAMLKAAAEELGWNMKYFSASTLDPFADLIGIPVPNMETRTMEYFRDTSIDDADVVFFDEANRASDQVINSIFEITQFRSLNGKALPNLKAVAIAINPVEEGYAGNDELDMAFIDRFDVFLQAAVQADRAYFKRRFGATYAQAGLVFFDEYQKNYNAALRSKKNPMGYLSPRRLEKIMATFQKFPTEATLKASVPGHVDISTKAVAAAFNAALAAQVKVAKSAPVASGAPLAEQVDAFLNIPARERHRAPHRAQVKGTWRALVDGKAIQGELGQKFIAGWMESHKANLGAKTLVTHYSDVLEALTPHQYATLTALWSATKLDELEALLPPR